MIHPSLHFFFCGCGDSNSGGAAGDIAEEVKLIDEFTHPKHGRTSNCFRITYRSMERSLTDEEINKIQDQVRADTVTKLGVELR